MKSMEFADPDLFSSAVPLDRSYVSYQLYFELPLAAKIRVGKLGTHIFLPGTYVYTGSARKNIRGRILRHIAGRKKKRWHIDYLSSRPEINFTRILVSDAGECELNRRAPGHVSVAGFGSSDCKNGCSSHLKFISAFEK